MHRFPELTRRQMLISGTSTAAAALLARPSMAAQRRSVSGWIDAHSHIWTRDVERFPLANGQTVDDLKPASFTAEELLATCRPVGVQRVVLIQHHTYHGWDNTYLTHVATQQPELFRVVGMVDDTAESPDHTMRELRKAHVTGIRITPALRGKQEWLDGPGMAGMWKCGAETGQAMCCLINPDDLAGVDRMCQRYPDTPVVIDHFARIGIDGEIRKSDLDQLCRLARHRHTHLKISAYYALGKKQAPYTDLLPMIRRVLDAFGVERCMWASDAPYQVVAPHTYKASIDLVTQHLDVSDGDREWLLRKTAAKVYAFD